MLSILLVNPRRACAARVTVVNPRRACAARVTVVVMSVCLSVCLSVTPLERLFVLKTLSHTQRATKVKKIVGFSLKPLRCRDPALPPLYGHAYSRPFFHAYFSCTRMRISRVYTRMIHRRGFSTLVLFIGSVCVSVKSHLTYGASVSPENAVTYSAGNEGQKNVGFSLKPLRCRDTALAALYRYPCSRPFLFRGKRACAYLTTPRALEPRATKAVYENLCTQDKVINATPSYKAKLDCLTTALWKNADFLRNEIYA